MNLPQTENRWPICFLNETSFKFNKNEEKLIKMFLDITYLQYFKDLQAKLFLGWDNCRFVSEMTSPDLIIDINTIFGICISVVCFASE